MPRMCSRRPRPRTYSLTSAARTAASGCSTARRNAPRRTGDKNFAAGRAYLGYGQYDKAVDQLSKALSKGGLKNEADARLTLGIAQLKAGHKDDAVKTFKAVKGDPALERLAGLWSIHATQGSGTTVSQSEKPKGTKAKHPSKVARAQ